jgi:zinc/manganese transport system substrate-binding protein
MRRRTLYSWLLAPVLLGALLAGCRASPSSRGAAGAGHGKFVVVAAENFWGSIAAQLAGGKATVESIIANPGTDPHSYEPSARDARSVVGARLAIVNGLGYDNWMSQLLDADPEGGRIVLNAGTVLGLGDGENPHQWYSPTSVYRIIDRIVADYDRLDPADSSYFAQRKQAFETRALARYNRLREEIRSSYAGVAVGYSESIFRPLGEDLGLKLITPYSFAKAIAEGTDVSAQDKRTVDEQAEGNKIKVWVYNSQNVTPDVQRLNSLAKAHQIPIATVTETLSPATASFQQWQVAELEGLLSALKRAH